MSEPPDEQHLDQAVALYWKRRPTASRPALTEHRRRQIRQRTPVHIWLRRADA